jgi:hypothetical protein
LNDIPVERVIAQFSFLDEIVSHCNSLFKATEGASSESEETSSCEYLPPGGTIPEKNSQLPNIEAAEEDEEEEEYIVVNSGKNICEQIDQYADDEETDSPLTEEEGDENAAQSGNSGAIGSEDSVSAAPIDSTEPEDWKKIGPSEFESFTESPQEEPPVESDSYEQEYETDEEEEIEEVSPVEEDEADDSPAPNAGKPLLNSPQKHVARFDEEKWPEVAAILIAAQKDSRKHWKSYAKKIDGGQGHCLYTLRFWYDRLDENPDWRPTREACGSANKILSTEVEELIWIQINKRFVSKRLLFTDKQCSAIALEVVKRLPPQKKPDTPFCASYEWVRRFRERHMISLRTPHLKRRPHGNLKSITSYIHRLNEALHSGMNKSHIVNADETNWPVIFANRKSWSPVVKEKAEKTDFLAFVDADVKMSFTVMAGITANGDALPLFMLAKGKTDLCEQQLQALAENEIFHSPSGWVTVQVMEEYFKFLRQTMEQQLNLGKRDKVLLIIDLYASHRQPELIRKAAEQHTELLFIPAGMTAELQPLDAKIFGQLKSVGAAHWTDQYIFDPTQKFSKKTASINLQKSWNEVTRSNVRGAWRTVLLNGTRYFLEAGLDPFVLSESTDQSDAQENSSSEFKE